MKLGMLKEYLVGLGFSVDDKTYDAAMGKMKTFEKVAGKMAGNVGKSVAKGSAIAVAALATVTVGVTKYVSSVADADMATEKFARRMWMTETNARSLQNVLGAMGESMDSIYDVAANAELRSSFFQLRADAAKLEGGPEIDEAMVKIRNVQFEVQRLKLLLSYASRYIAYYLTQYLAVPMEEVRQKLKAINDNGENIVKVWGDKVAKVLSWIVRLALSGAHAVSDLFGTLFGALKKLPYEVKAVGAALMAVGLAVAMPWAGVAMAIGAVLLLLDDFYTWQRGGESMFGDTWQQLTDFQEKLANTTFESQALNDLIKLLDEIKEKFSSIGTEWDKLNIKLGKVDGISVIQAILVGIDAATWSIRQNFKAFVDFIGFLIGKVGDLISNGLDFSKWDWSQPKALLEEIKKEIGLIFSPKSSKGASEPEGKDKASFKLPKLALPAVANPAVSKAMSMMKQHNEIEQDNSLNSQVNVTVYGTDPNSTATATAKELEAIMLRLMTPWSAARIKTIPTS